MVTDSCDRTSVVQSRFGCRLRSRKAGGGARFAIRNTRRLQGETAAALAAVDVEDLARDEPGEVGSEKTDGAGDVVDGPHFADRLDPDPAFPHFFGKTPCERRINESRSEHQAGFRIGIQPERRQGQQRQDRESKQSSYLQHDYTTLTAMRWQALLR